MKSGILHTLKFDLHTLSCHFWLNLCFNGILWFHYPTSHLPLHPYQLYQSWPDVGNVRFKLSVNLSWHVWVGVGGFSKVVATFNHVGGSFNLFMATTGDVWVIPSFRMWDYVLHVVHISRVFMNCSQSSCWPVYCVLSMWGEIVIPMYSLWLHSLYGWFQKQSTENDMYCVPHL